MASTSHSPSPSSASSSLTNIDTPNTSPASPELPRRRRHSAYLSSHPHPYHPSPSTAAENRDNQRQGQPPCVTLSQPAAQGRSEPFHPRFRPRAYSTPAQLEPCPFRAHSRWFYGPAPPSLSGCPTAYPVTKLEREISRDEQQMQMYGGDAPHDPLPKISPGEEAEREEEAEEEELEGTVVASPTDTLDSNLVGWDGPDDPENPQNYSQRRKWVITLLCVLMSLNVTFASSAPSTTTVALQAHFAISKEVSYLVTTMFLLGYVIGPLFWGPGSELVGRKPILVLSLTAYTLFHLGQTLAQNIQTLLITRFFGGFFAVAPLIVSGGVIADIWSALGRGPATSLFSASVFLGPVLGPIISGFIIVRGVDWRWVYWVMMFFAAGCTILTIPFLPETYAPIILLRKVRRLRKEDPKGNVNLYAEHEKQDWSWRGVLNRTLFRPFKMLAMEPILVLVTVYLSIVYGLLYALFQAFPIVFGQKHNFTIAEVGLIFIGVGIGTTLGALTNFWFSLEYPKLITKWRGFPPAENRLKGGMIGSPLLVIGIFWLGWTGQYSSIPWYVPGLSTILIGYAISLIFMSFLSYLVDTYLMYSASAFAANTVVRSAVAAAFPLFTTQMFNGMGVNWACTLIGLVGLVFLPSPFLFYKYGARVREKSLFAPCIDLKIKKELEEQERRENKEVSEGTKV